MDKADMTVLTETAKHLERPLSDPGELADYLARHSISQKSKIQSQLVQLELRRNEREAERDRLTKAWRAAREGGLSSTALEPIVKELNTAADGLDSVTRALDETRAQLIRISTGLTAEQHNLERLVRRVQDALRMVDPNSEPTTDLRTVLQNVVASVIVAENGELRVSFKGPEGLQSALSSIAELELNSARIEREVRGAIGAPVD